MKKIAFIFTVALGLLTVSCDSYMDINQDPNSPSEENMTTDILMPAAEMNFVSSYGDAMRIIGGYLSQHYAQVFGTSNYMEYSKFNVTATNTSTTYGQINSRALKNLTTVRQLAEKNGEWGSYLAAATMRAFIYQALVDAYGEIPYSEAFSGNTSPKYDDGADIYAGILAEIDDALGKVQAGDKVATNFLFPDKNAAEWIKFANAVKLKILMREYDVNPDAAAQVKAIVEEGNLPTADVAYKGCWKDESGAMSPFYAEEFSSSWGSTQINVVANLALINTMRQTNASGDVTYEDPRLGKFFEKNGSGAYTGGVSGTNFSTTNTYKAAYWCRPVASFDMPVYMITLSEIEFFISEYYARTGNAGEAKAHYEAAIEASCATAGVGDADKVIAQFPYEQSNWKKSIGISKWIALAGTNNFEAWCEARRLDYPAMGTVSGDAIYNEQTDAFKPTLYVPGTLYTPIKVEDKVGAGKIVERWFYPESSTSRNANSPEFPGFTVPVFWGK